ncbi:MAG: hypothetical protein KGM99_17455, partial [Burkholderiales bacterium]|nr:hypothetical protein [Burkholderiales bacterium]
KQHSSVHVNIDSHLQGIGIWHGIGMLLGSILLMMFSMFMTKYTYIGFKNYLNWNIAQVRLSQHA